MVTSIQCTWPPSVATALAGASLLEAALASGEVTAEFLVKIDLAESDGDIVACFSVIRHLRELEDALSFLRRVRSQQLSGYQLAALRDGGEPVAVAGFRLGESLAWGHYLYVDDLVTLPEARSRGYGAALLTWLAEFGRARGAGQLHLDSGRQRAEAHRFYEREGLDGSSIHFKRSL